MPRLVVPLRGSERGWEVQEKSASGLLDVWDGERRARLLQQALPQLSLYAGSALMVEPEMLFPSLTVVAMKAAVNPLVL